MRGSETPYPIWIKFCRLVGIYNIITCVNFGEDRLRGLGAAGGSKFALLHWLWSSPLQHSRTTVWVCDGQVITFYPFDCYLLSFFFLPFFLACSQQSQIGCLPYFHRWRGVSANLECRSQNVLHTSRWKYRMQKIAKNSPSAHHRTTLLGYIFATKAWSDSRKKTC